LDIANLRREYLHAALSEAEVDPDPMRQFERWLAEAISAELPEPTAMTLATADAGGRPSARIVLLKRADAEGFVFFTNYQSRKGSELAVRPEAALLFHWVELERQVRVEGKVAQVAPGDSDAYFATRPVESRIGAWASPQSRVISDRAWLEREFSAARERLSIGSELLRPAHQFGYGGVSQAVVFWEGGLLRLYDGVCYLLDSA